jgi:hypothetical protein
MRGKRWGMNGNKNSYDSVVLRRPRKIAKSDYQLCHVSVCPTTRNNSPLTVRISIKFVIWVFFVKFLEEIQVSLKYDKNNGYLTWRVCLFFVCLFPWASAASHGGTSAYLAFCTARFGVPTLATRCPRAYRRVPHSSGGSWNLWARNKDRQFSLNADIHGTF